MKATDRTRAAALEDLPNVGTLIAGDLRRIGIHAPQALAGRDPYALYDTLNRVSGVRHDPCVLDTFIAAVRFANGGPRQPWWAFTAERKRVLQARQRLFQSQTDYARSRYDYLLNVLRLQQAAGTLDRKGLDDINTILSENVSVR